MCQQQYDRICRLDIRHHKSSRNSEYFQDQPFMYERFRKEKIVEAKIQRLRNAMGVMDTIVTFQNGAWYARHAGSQVSTWRRFGTRLRAVSFSSDLVRAVHARGTGEVARRAERGRQPSVSRHQSRAWPFACLAFCSTDYRKKRDCS